MSERSAREATPHWTFTIAKVIAIAGIVAVVVFMALAAALMVWALGLPD